jgi:3-oxoacyl-[acyl-carrier-protein] synthase-1
MSPAGQTEGGDVVVSGLGVRAPVGHHAVQACASIRAGINRFRGWRHLDGGPPASYFLPDMGDDPWPEKAFRLLELPFSEALWSAGLSTLPAQLVAGREAPRVQVFVGVPALGRQGVDGNRLVELKEELEEDLLPDARLSIEFVPGDQVAGLLAIAHACSALQDRKADFCIVAGVDSLLESQQLSVLAEQGRLKSDATSSGLVPGEGAAVLVLETAKSARRRGAGVLGRIHRVGLEQGPPWGAEEPIRGDAMTRAVSSVLSGASVESLGLHRVISDVNGERWRFLEAALVETRCLSFLPPGWELWRPADCVGDVGAAYGILAVAMAARGFERGYAGPGGVLILATAEDGGRGAMSLTGPGEHG